MKSEVHARTAQTCQAGKSMQMFTCLFLNDCPLESAAPIMALLPCGHRCVCEQCGPTLSNKACPICRTICTAVQRIFD